jgi:hypothetical protein
MDQHVVRIPQVSPLPSEGWERVPKGRVRALVGRYKVVMLKGNVSKQRALIRPSATFSHASRGRRGKCERASVHIMEFL